MQYVVTSSYDHDNGERKSGMKAFENAFAAKNFMMSGEWLPGSYRPGIGCALYEVDASDARQASKMIHQKRAKLLRSWRDHPPDYEWWNDQVFIDDFFKDLKNG